MIPHMDYSPREKLLKFQILEQSVEVPLSCIKPAPVPLNHGNYMLVSGAESCAILPDVILLNMSNGRLRALAGQLVEGHTRIPGITGLKKSY